MLVGPWKGRRRRGWTTRRLILTRMMTSWILTTRSLSLNGTSRNLCRGYRRITLQCTWENWSSIRWQGVVKGRRSRPQSEMKMLVFWRNLRGRPKRISKRGYYKSYGRRSPVKFADSISTIRRSLDFFKSALLGDWWCYDARGGAWPDHGLVSYCVLGFEETRCS